TTAPSACGRRTANCRPRPSPPKWSSSRRPHRTAAKCYCSCPCTRRCTAGNSPPSAGAWASRPWDDSLLAEVDPEPPAEGLGHQEFAAPPTEGLLERDADSPFEDVARFLPAVVGAVEPSEAVPTVSADEEADEAAGEYVGAVAVGVREEVRPFEQRVQR